MAETVAVALTLSMLTPPKRRRRCPVGQHWATMHPGNEADLTSEGRTTLDGEAQP